MSLRWIVAFIALAAAGWWGYTHYKAGSDKKTAAVSATKVSLAPAIRQSVPLTLQVAGNVIAYETVAIKSRIDSQVMEVTFKDGDHVEQGQVLFVLDDRSLKTQINQLQASVQKEKAQLENAELQYERARKLVESRTIAQSQFDTAKAAWQGQQAAVSAMQASLDNTTVLLSYSTIKAPISGRAGTINVTKGNNVKANDTAPMVTINQVSPIRVQFAIPERYYEQVKAAMSQGPVAVQAKREQAKEESQGTLEYIDNTIDTSTGAFSARATFANEGEALWPGMFATVVLGLSREDNVLTVPAVALQGDTGKQFVFKAVDGKAVKTPVQVSRNTGEVGIITSGLNDGDQVIVDGLLRVADGGSIEVSQPALAPAAGQPAPEAPKP